VHLPMAFEDSTTLEAVARYRKSVRNRAPWLPSNTEFIRRINGLKDVDQVRRILFQASYLVLGLGDVYLGAPCAVPIDPRHRLMTSKYNPARTHTAEGAVGIGGVYMCIYGMDSPGGYQLVGRTLPIWSQFPKNPCFTEGRNWLLRFFDQVRFYPVSERELTAQREAFREGRAAVRMEERLFDLAAYERFLAANAADIAAFRQRQKAAFDREVALWEADRNPDKGGENLEPKLKEPEGIEGFAVRAPISGCVWKLQVEPGERIKEGRVLAVVEAMKMEFPVAAESAGTVGTVYCPAGTQVAAGDLLMVLLPARRLKAKVSKIPSDGTMKGNP
jgi:urea carboxylase